MKVRGVVGAVVVMTAEQGGVVEIGHPALCPFDPVVGFGPGGCRDLKSPTRIRDSCAGPRNTSVWLVRIAPW